MIELIGDIQEFERRIDAALDPPATTLVAKYFDPDGNFAADTFDTLGTNDPNRITIDDLLAVTMLDVRVMPLAARALLGKEAEAASDLLAAIPLDVRLWDATDEHLGRATTVWKFLRAGHRGIDWVTAGKLLARKRPHLIPVYDSVVKAALDPAGSFWEALRQALGDEGRRRNIEALRPQGLPPQVSTIRLLDVAVWMRNSESTAARTARRDVGLEVAPRATR